MGIPLVGRLVWDFLQPFSRYGPLNMPRVIIDYLIRCNTLADLVKESQSVLVTASQWRIFFPRGIFNKQRLFVDSFNYWIPFLFGLIDFNWKLNKSMVCNLRIRITWVNCNELLYITKNSSSANEYSTAAIRPLIYCPKDVCKIMCFGICNVYNEIPDHTLQWLFCSV